MLIFHDSLLIVAFREPVDWKGLMLFDYPRIIKSYQSRDDILHVIFVNIIER